MIEKLIEDWLTKTNERGYQLPFCQVLIAKGYQVQLISSHGPGEHGKDVVAVDSSNRTWAFQLKCGDIRLSDWRRMCDEVRDLVCLPVEGPYSRSRRQYVPVLVTNGELRGDAKTSIDGYARTWRDKGAPQLLVWNGGTLRTMFIEAHESYIAERLPEFKALLELYVGDFRDILPREQFATLLHALARSTTIRGRSARRVKAGIANLCLVGGYVVEQYERVENHLAAAQGWTILAATILYLKEANGLGALAYESSLELVRAGFERSAAKFIEEATCREHLVSGRDLPAEPLVLPVRVMIILSWLAALGLRMMRDDTTQRMREKIRAVILRESKNMKLSGEVDWPGVLAISLFLENMGNVREAEGLLELWVRVLLANNHDDKGSGVPSPYWLHEQVLRLMNGDIPAHERESCVGYSYTLASALDMLVRRLRRSLIASIWEAASKIRWQDMRPEQRAEWFLWKSRRATLWNTAPAPRRSWSEWRKKATEDVKRKVPPSLVRHRGWAFPFVLTYPHRANRCMTAWLDQVYGAGTVISKRP